jgi:uncharacterized 2Fe-2S/4Fe-4S cluster protein (DUF4445 family)
MTLLRAKYQDRTATAPALPGATILDALAPTELRVRTGCNGNGSCGLCRVRILSGPVSTPTEEERINLGPALLEAGVRLACQTTALGEVALEVENLAPRTEWTGIADGLLDGPGRRAPAPAGAAAALVALDIGTTNLNLTVWDPRGSRRRAALRGANPQVRFGADIIARLEAAADPAAARRLAGAIEHAVAAALQVAAAEAGPDASCAVMAVGNTAMLALLRGSGEALLAPGAWACPALWPPEERLRWDLFDHRQADVTLVPPLGGFVGSDLLAAALAAGLAQDLGPTLLVDFGTNTEIALWDGATLWVTSAAGGPAFEACGLSCGVPADDGAIARVRPGSPLGFEVIGGVAPKGVCGTGLVDWIACLVQSGTLTRTGNFHLRNGAGPPALGGAERGISLSKRDIDIFQRAKAAIGAGIQILMDQAGIRSRDLGRVVTTGLFGRGLDIANAQAIGLLPGVPAERVETHCNLALAGCEAMLIAPEGAHAADPLRARVRIVNMAACHDFEDHYVRNLFLAPLENP